MWADEPTGNLDSETAADIIELLIEVNGNGQTVVMVTHDQAIASTGTRIVEVRDGQIHRDETQSQGGAVTL